MKCSSLKKALETSLPIKEVPIKTQKKKQTTGLQCYAPLRGCPDYWAIVDLSARMTVPSPYTSPTVRGRGR